MLSNCVTSSGINYLCDDENSPVGSLDIFLLHSHEISKTDREVIKKIIKKTDFNSDRLKSSYNKQQTFTELIIFYPDLLPSRLDVSPLPSNAIARIFSLGSNDSIEWMLSTDLNYLKKISKPYTDTKKAWKVIYDYLGDEKFINLIIDNIESITCKTTMRYIYRLCPQILSSMNDGVLSRQCLSAKELSYLMTIHDCQLLEYASAEVIEWIKGKCTMEVLSGVSSSSAIMKKSLEKISNVE